MESEQLYNEDNISFDTLIDYVFKELSDKEEQAMEAFLGDSDEYSSIVDAIMDFCIEKRFKTKKALNSYLAANKAGLLADLKEKLPDQPVQHNEHSSKNRFIYILIAFILMLLIGYGIYRWSSPPPQLIIAKVLNEEERNTEINEVWKEEHQSYVSASGQNDNWEVFFVKKLYTKSMDILNRLLNDTSAPHLLQEYYFAGIFNLYTTTGDSSKALDFLKKSEGFRDDDESNYSKHLIIAYVENGEISAAKALLSKYPDYVQQLPISIRKALNQQ